MATANVRFAVFESSPNHLLLQASRDVEPFEEFGCDYGPSYNWGNITPMLFDRNGNVIPSEEYMVINRRLSVDFSGYNVMVELPHEPEVGQILSYPLEPVGTVQVRLTESLLRNIRDGWSLVVRTTGSFVPHA